MHRIIWKISEKKKRCAFQHPLFTIVTHTQQTFSQIDYAANCWPKELQLLEVFPHCFCKIVLRITAMIIWLFRVRCLDWHKWNNQSFFTSPYLIISLTIYFLLYFFFLRFGNSNRNIKSIELWTQMLNQYQKKTNLRQIHLNFQRIPTLL